jgi:hypothetical protein
MEDASAAAVVATLWQSWRENSRRGARNDRERAFWEGYALGRRQAARQLAYAIGEPDPAKADPTFDNRPCHR